MINEKQHPTIRDVAKVAGVSIQTVSAVINRKPGITAATTQVVKHAIEQVGYRPHAIAASLRTRKTRTIALIISDIANPSLSVMASAAERAANAFGYNLIFYNTHDDPEREELSIRVAAQRWADGIIIVSAGDRMPSWEVLRSTGVNFVPIERIPEGYPGPSVCFDNLESGRLAARHLVELGHTRCAHLSGTLKLAPARDRFEGFRQELEARRIATPRLSSGEGWDCESGYRTMQRVLSTGPNPTGVFCANDRIALGAIHALSEVGFRVPQDISIMGVDNFETAAYHNPPLTTIAQPFSAMATVAVKLLLDLLEDRPQEDPQPVLAPQLVVRGSTGPAPTQ